MRIRSLEQNGYYWAGVLPAAAEGLIAAGRKPRTAQRLHAIFKRAFLLAGEIDRNTGEFIASSVRSTTELTGSEFFQYIERIKVCVGKYGIIIPEPKFYHQHAEAS